MCVCEREYFIRLCVCGVHAIIVHWHSRFVVTNTHLYGFLLVPPGVFTNRIKYDVYCSILSDWQKILYHYKSSKIKINNVIGMRESGTVVIAHAQEYKRSTILIYKNLR